MNTKQLRQKILDLAIKGKLVLQDPNDEPASKLLERIREEKEQLIKEGKLKRDKNESYIFVGDDKLHYEKFSDGNVVCIEDEIPFEIPESWVWARGKEIFKGLSSTKPSNDFFKYIDIDAIDNKLHVVKAPKQIATKDAPSRASRYLEFGDTLFSMVRPYLENIAYISEELKDCIASTGFYVCSPYQNLNSEFIYHLMLSKYVISGLNSFMKGDNSPSINASDIEDFLYPIPPIHEQQRITKTIKELLSIVETLENDKLDLSDLIKQTKIKVLDLAIRGKLVPQNPNDEPADKLLEKIREEKEKLIKEGKLKRDKNETFIFKNSDDNSYYEQIDGETVCIDDDLPFEIPDSWRWCRLSNTCNYIQRGKSPKYTELKKYPVISQKCVRWSGLDMQPAKFIIEESLKKYEEVRFLRDNDILWNSTGTGTVGRAAIYNSKLNPFNIAVADSHVTVLRPMFVESLYIYDFIMSPHIQVGFEDLCDGSTNQKELSLTTVSEFLIPLPPVDEQKRISEVVENIFLYLDNLESIIKGS